MLADAPQNYVADLAAAIDRLERLLPKKSTWSTAFAAELASQALMVASIVTQLGVDMLSRGGIPREATEAVANVGDLVIESEEPVTKDALVIAQAQRAGDAVVTVPALRGDVLRLLRTVIVGWRELWFLSDARPIFLKFSKGAASDFKIAMGAIFDAGVRLHEIVVPSFPPQPVPPKEPARPRRALGFLLGAVAIAGGGIVFLVRRKRRA